MTCYSSNIDAGFIARALSGHKSGSGYVARCPAHDDQAPSLSIRDSGDGKVLVKCHTGCSQKSVISELKKRGLWHDNKRRPFMRSARRLEPQQKKSTAPVNSNSEFALSVWKTSRSPDNSPVSTYLESRGITITLPPTLRFNPSLKHPCGRTHSAMIGLVTSGVENTPTGIHRTFLTPDGSSKADIERNKLMLGLCRGGAVRLGDVTDLVMIGEGIETCLSAMQVTGKPAWAALSTSGMKSLILPETVQEVIVLVDSDEAGEAAAIACASKWKREGRRVRLARPPKGSDFNDMLIDSIKRRGGDYHD